MRFHLIDRVDAYEPGQSVRARKLTSKSETLWEDTPLYFKEISYVGSNASGFEEIAGVRKHGIAHYLDLVRDGRVDLTGMLTHNFRLEDWRDAFVALATQDRSGAIKVAFDFR